MTFAFVNPIWDDFATQDELPEVFADLLAAGLPFTITAISSESKPDASCIDEDVWHLHPSLTAAQRNPSL